VASLFHPGDAHLAGPESALSLECRNNPCALGPSRPRSGNSRGISPTVLLRETFASDGEKVAGWPKSNCFLSGREPGSIDAGDPVEVRGRRCGGPRKNGCAGAGIGAVVGAMNNVPLTISRTAGALLGGGGDGKSERRPGPAVPVFRHGKRLNCVPARSRGHVTPTPSIAPGETGRPQALVPGRQSPVGQREGRSGSGRRRFSLPRTGGLGGLPKRHTFATADPQTPQAALSPVLPCCIGRGKRDAPPWRCAGLRFAAPTGGGGTVGRNGAYSSGTL